MPSVKNPPFCENCGKPVPRNAHFSGLCSQSCLDENNSRVLEEARGGERVICLFNPQKEGIIVLSDEGQLFTNQTGGVSCNHPEARGFFTEQEIPALIKNLCYDRSSLDNSIEEQIDNYFAHHHSAWRVDRDKPNEEAWVFLKDTLTDEVAIMTWENSD